MHNVLVAIGHLWRRLITKGQEREVRAAKSIEESSFLPVRGKDIGRIGGTISSADACCVIEIVGQRTTPVRDAQLRRIGDRIFAQCGFD